jgi:UDP:flavonoid glycosyltransferase YjiC (YdhE family)
MRVLVTVSAWSGLYRSLIPLGWALQSAGHDVRVVCHESEVATLSGAGLTPVPLTDGWDLKFAGRLKNYLNATTDMWPWPHLPLHPVTAEPMQQLSDFDFDAFMRADRPVLEQRLRASTDAVVGFARDWRPRLVLHDILSLEGLLAAKVTGIPACAHPWGPLGTAEDDPEAAVMPADFSFAFTRYGLRPMSFDHLDYFVDPCPPSLAPPTKAARLPYRYVPYNGPVVIQPWTLEQSSRKRVGVVWGNSVTPVFGEGSWFVPMVVEALSGLDVETVIALNKADFGAMGGVPDGVRLVQNVPVHTFWDSCSVVIHHGGGNAVLNGAHAGVPQLAVSMGHDAHLIGSRLAATGAGLQMPGYETDAAALRAAVTELLDDPGYADAARRLRDEVLAAPSPAELVTTLEEIALAFRDAPP